MITYCKYPAHNRLMEKANTDMHCYQRLKHELNRLIDANTGIYYKVIIEAKTLKGQGSWDTA